jgi:hypothetical protein
VSFSIQQLNNWLTRRSLLLGRVSPYLSLARVSPDRPQEFYASVKGVKQEIAQEFDDRRLFVLSGEHIQLNGRKGFQAGYPVIHG